MSYFSVGPDVNTRSSYEPGRLSGSRLNSTHLLPIDAHKTDPSNFWLRLLSHHSRRSAAITFEIPPDFSELPFTYLMEVQRQAGLAFAHHTLGVPQSEAFILKSMALSRNSQNLAVTRTGTVQIEAGDSRTAGGALKQAEIRSEIQNGNGAAIFHGDLVSSFIRKDIHERIRKRTVNRAKVIDKCDVCNNMSTGGTLLDIDMPKLRDHDSDHLAAIEVVAAIEERINTIFSGEILGLSISFNNYVELVPLPVIRFISKSSNLVSGCIHQGRILGATFQAVTSQIGS